MDYMQQHALKSADPKYKEYTSKIQAAHREKCQTNSKQCMLIRELTNLSASLELTRRKSWEFESRSKKQDKLLEQYTGEDGEMWYYTYKGAADEIEKMMIQKCIKVANLAVQWDVLTERISKLNKDQDKYGDKLVEKAREASN